MENLVPLRKEVGMRAFLLGMAGGVTGTLLSLVVANAFHEWERRRTAERILAGQNPNLLHRVKLLVLLVVILIAGYAAYRWAA